MADLSIRGEVIDLNQLGAIASDPEEHSRLKRRWASIGLVVLVSALNVYMVVTNPQGATPYQAFLSSAALWVLTVPPGLSFIHSPRHVFPFRVAVSAVYALYYVMPAFESTPLYERKALSGWHSADQAMELVLLGSVAMMAGLFLARPLFARVKPIRREIDMRGALPTLAIVAAFSGALRIAIVGVKSQTFGSLFTWIQNVGLIALAAFVLAWLRGQLSIAFRIYTTILVLVLIVSGLSTGAIANFMFPLLCILFIYGWERRTVPWGLMLALAVLLYPLNAVKGKFRAQHWNNGRQENMVTLFTSFVALGADAVMTGDFASDEAADANSARTNFLGLLTFVVGETPGRVPYWNGATYSDLLWKFIPRRLVPDKPTQQLGQDFARRYGILDYEDYDTAVNLAALIEGYINFGTLGVISVMLVVGLIYGLLEHIFCASSGGAIIGAAVFAGLLDIESSFTGSFGGVLLPVLGYYVFIRALPELREGE